MGMPRTMFPLTQRRPPALAPYPLFGKPCAQLWGPSPCEWSQARHSSEHASPRAGSSPLARHPSEKVGRGGRRRGCGGASTLVLTSEFVRNRPWAALKPQFWAL